jgi:hypothetical protein
MQKPARHSPAGRQIVIRHPGERVVPRWIQRRRRAYKLIDAVANGAKHVIRRWLVPRPGRSRSSRPTR